ncbi:MAG: hypothetical protein IJB01_07440 [Bacteroidaceae bacterium]|nr:hypothetical protein [Bacteroidaceae bacterium]
MKNKIFKLAIMLFCITNCNEAFAQFYDSHNCYLYIEMGKTIESSSYINYYHFDEDGNMFAQELTKDKVRKLISDDILEEYAVNHWHRYEYCNSTSTHKYEVYKFEKTREVQEGWGVTLYGTGEFLYCAFSLDRSSLITWYTAKDSNSPINKKHYKRIVPENLTPKEADYDFLR